MSAHHRERQTVIDTRALLEGRRVHASELIPCSVTTGHPTLQSTSHTRAFMCVQSVLSRACCPEHAVRSMLSRARCPEHAVQSTLSGACCPEHAVQSMLSGACLLASVRVANGQSCFHIAYVTDPVSILNTDWPGAPLISSLMCGKVMTTEHAVMSCHVI